MTGEVEAFCRCCGSVTVSVRLIRLIVSNVAQECSASWNCPRCGEYHEKIAKGPDQEILLDAGALAEVWHIPEEALEPHLGPPLGDGDLAAFQYGLEHFAGLADAADLAPSAAVDTVGEAPQPPASRAQRLIDLLRHLAATGGPVAPPW